MPNGAVSDWNNGFGHGMNDRPCGRDDLSRPQQLERDNLHIVVSDFVRRPFARHLRDHRRCCCFCDDCRRLHRNSTWSIYLQTILTRRSNIWMIDVVSCCCCLIVVSLLFHCCFMLLCSFLFRLARWGRRTDGKVQSRR